MPKLMRCTYCGLLQDEPEGVKACARCGGELAFEIAMPSSSYIQAQLELDQINAPAGQIVDRHLVLTIQTPSEVPAGEAAPTAAGREPMGFCAVLDVSGSMRGPKLGAAKEAVRQSVHRLQDGDVFSLVTFANDVKTHVAPAVVDGRLRLRVERTLDKIRSGGRTALCGGLEAGIAAARRKRQETNLVLLLSDGQANEGETDLESIGQRSYNALQYGVTTSTLGVGSDYNEALMVEIATQGGGRFYHVLHSHQIAPFVAGEVGEVSALAAKAAVLNLNLPPGTGLQPFSSAYAVQSLTRVMIGDIPIATTLEVVFRVLLPPQDAGSRLPIDGSLTYESPAGNQLETQLNVVTLRFRPSDSFAFRDGAVGPVVRRVLDQMSARTVLGSSRLAATQGRAVAQKRWDEDAADIRRYASLLGDAPERAEFLAEANLDAPAFLRRAPAAKAAAFRAFSRQRGTKDFDKS
jgi:Ca-activated chloride channel family protein